MSLISKVIEKAPKDMSCHQFCITATRAIAANYKTSQLEHLVHHPEERLTASCVVFSRLRREIWMIGDCQCLIGNTFYDNPKPYEHIVAERRAQIIADSPLPHDHFLSDDVARKAVIPLMLESMQEQNKTYSVIDGFPIPEKYVKVISLDFQPWEIVLASDGYPFLCNTLDESEQKLAHQKSTDPLNIGNFKATKGFMQGNNSFDDRAYIRFQV